MNFAGVKLNRDQARALKEIMQHYDSQPKGGRHLLDGDAGTGKTTLLRAVAEALRARRVKVAVCAPTHKAVGVLRLALHGPHSHEYGFYTIHSLVGLTPSEDGEKATFSKRGEGRFEECDAVIIDECSMLNSDAQHHIDDALQEHFVLYVGDQGQLPPVGENLAACFATPSRTTLTKIVRQARGNPIIKLAAQVRARQGEPEDFAWCQEMVTADRGVYVPSKAEGLAWVKSAFTSEEFRANKDAYRVLAHRNKIVIAINQRIRGWIYGQTDTPFVVGEQLLCRQPVGEEGTDPLFKTNDEGTVTSIERVMQRFEFPAVEGDEADPLRDDDEMEDPDAWRSEVAVAKKLPPLDAWDVTIDVWKIELRHLASPELATTFLPATVAATNKSKQTEHALSREARKNRGRWRDYYRFQRAFGDLRHCYAMTVHCAQGSTYGTVFVQMADIALMVKPRLRRPTRPGTQLEMQKLIYTAMTRPSQTLVLLRTELIKPATAPIILPAPVELPSPPASIIHLPEGSA